MINVQNIASLTTCMECRIVDKCHNFHNCGMNLWISATIATHKWRHPPLGGCHFVWQRHRAEGNHCDLWKRKAVKKQQLVENCKFAKNCKMGLR